MNATQTKKQITRGMTHKKSWKVLAYEHGQSNFSTREKALYFG